MSPDDLRALRHDKYNDDPAADLSTDIKRVESGEPLAYVIGWVPFLGLRIWLDSHPLIPRSETEWWTERLIAHLRDTFDNRPFRLLDLCAGSGAIGLAVLRHLPRAEVIFAELESRHLNLIRKNIETNGLDAARAQVVAGDLFEHVEGTFAVIASNPPYIPEERILPESVSGYEPPEALFAGPDGLRLIRRIAHEAPAHLTEAGEVWVEGDVVHANEIEAIFTEAGAQKTTLHNDQYGRPRLLVSYW